jgi:hypothetical protein
MPNRSEIEVKLRARTLFSAVHGIVSLGLAEKLGDSASATLDAELEKFIATFSRGVAIAEADEVAKGAICKNSRA